MPLKLICNGSEYSKSIERHGHVTWISFILIKACTRKTVSDHNCKHWEESWTYDARRSVFDEHWGVVKRCRQCLIYAIKLKLGRKRRNNIVKIYANSDQTSKHRHSHDFLWSNQKHITSNVVMCFCLNLMNYLYFWEVLFNYGTALEMFLTKNADYQHLLTLRIVSLCVNRP